MYINKRDVDDSMENVDGCMITVPHDTGFYNVLHRPVLFVIFFRLSFEHKTSLSSLVHHARH